MSPDTRRARGHAVAAAMITASLALAAPASAKPLSVSDWTGFDSVEDHSVVALDLSLGLSPSASARLTYFSGRSEFLQSCAYGAVAGVRVLEPSTPSNHLLLEIWPGPPEDFAANGVFCEYMVDRAKVVGEGFLTVRGCYLAQIHAVPTARHITLRPLEPQACGWAR